MAISGVIQGILAAGTTNGITSRIYDGELPQQVTYPAVQIDDFSSSEACKSGAGPELYTVTVMAYGDTKKICDSIVDAAQVDLIGSKLHTQGLRRITGIKFIGRQGWFKDKDTRMWARPADFQVFVTN